MVSIPWDVLPLGYRFRPTDEELINHYLKRKIDGRINSDREVVIPEVDVCKCEPWDLPDRSLIRSDDSEWFFFSPKDRKYPSGNRANRATTAGYWKATGKDRLIRSRNRNVIGTKKTLVFHQGRAPKGVRTHWIMHEYRTTEAEFESGDQGGFVLYRLFKKSDERNSSPSEIEGSSQSPLPALSSPGNTLNETDPVEELGTPPNQVIPSILLKDQQQLADKSGCSAPLKRDESICTTNAASKLVDHEPEVAGELEDQVVQNLLEYFNSDYEQPYLDGFPKSTSSMQTYKDSPAQTYKNSPILSDMDQELYRQLFPDDIAEQKSNEFIGTIFNDQEEYSSQVLSTQRQGEADLECLHKQSLTSKDTLQNPSYEESHDMFSHSKHLLFHEIITPEAPAFAGTPLLNVVQNEDIFNLYRMGEEDVSLASLSVSGNADGHLDFENTTMVTPQQCQPGMHAEQSANQNYFIHQNEVPGSSASTGIRISPRPPLPVSDSSYLMAQQGTTLRRLRLQTNLTRRNGGARQYQMSLISRSRSFVGATYANLKWLMFIILLMSGVMFCWCLCRALFSY